MKILIPCRCCESEIENPFVLSLKKALEHNGAEVMCAVEPLLNKQMDFDVVLFQWPEAVFDFKSFDSHDLKNIAAIIEMLKKQGKVLAYTRHNTLPHYNNNPLLKSLYNLIESSVDCVFHMGEFSQNEFIESLVNCRAKNYIVSHHLTMSVAWNALDQKGARDYLKIKDSAAVILCFGSFRSDEERMMVLKTFKSLDLKGKVLLTPGLFNRRLFRRNPFGFARNIINRLKFLPYGKMATTKRVLNSDLPYYFNAADVVLIQRKMILNSGNLPMAFAYGKVVVGPCVGNVGEILSATGNPTFDPNDISSIKAAVTKAFALAYGGKGIENKRYAEQHWDVDKIGKQLLAYLQEYMNQLRK